ncbi:MAG: monothiol glutaredoxin, Grx4 family [Alphaproteobacteria bacterium 40-19]|nr:MAG: monothiol glutaredoxin, Grx4 family [Alphaproteobacteria bacterium 40-19]
MDFFAEIKKLMDRHPVFLFMKGTPERPFCGFSRTVVGILRILDVPFGSYDVLQDDQMRNAIKEFSCWPTFPQLYINGELIGGCDITRDLYEQGELEKMLLPFAKKT